MLHAVNVHSRKAEEDYHLPARGAHGQHLGSEAEVAGAVGKGALFWEAIMAAHA